MAFDTGGTAAVAVVTGGSRGIGRAFVVEAARRGYDVVFNYRTRDDEAEKVVHEVAGLGRRATAVRADLGSLENVLRMAEIARAAGPVSALVNNAGTVLSDPLGEIDHGRWADSVAVNLTAPLFLAQELAPELKVNRGAILNVSSIAGVSGSSIGSAYGASKAGLLGLSKSLARELGPEVRVNAIAPGLTENEEFFTWSEQERERWSHASLLRRAALPAEIATAGMDIVGWTACTGQTIIVDCGRRL